MSVSARVVKEPSQSRFAKKDRYRIGTLLYFGDEQGRLLLILRNRLPNKGLWCAVGGKLEMPIGESPYECAIREAKEEVGVELATSDLVLRCILSEKDYEQTGHWLMFVFQVFKPLEGLPDDIAEGRFGFFERTALETVSMPELDRRILLDRILSGDTDSLHVLRAGEGANRNPSLLVEEACIGGGS